MMSNHPDFFTFAAEPGSEILSSWIKQMVMLFISGYVILMVRI
jgi:hypothetical protein